MTGTVTFRMDADGNLTAWKIIVGGRRSHRLSRPLFPRHQPNYDFDHGVPVRVKALYRQEGAVPLDAEFARRK